MKILQINAHHYPLGGTETYYLSLSKLLENNGHQIAHLSMQDPQNVPSPWSRYFISHLDFDSKGISAYAHKLFRAIYSLEAQQKIKALLVDFSPDIVHIHNLSYFITPSILSTIKERDIPIVQTVHDYHLVSPNFQLFDHGRINEITKPNLYYKALLKPDLHDSFSGTLLAVLASYFQHSLKLYEKHISLHLSPSRFIMQTLAGYHFKPQKIIYLPNFIETKTTSSKSLDRSPKYVLLYGNLTPAKGINFMIEIAKQTPGIQYLFVGNFASSIKPPHVPNIRHLPHQIPSKMSEIIHRSTFVVVPSLWFENQPYTILESYLHSKPVIASRIGGIPEIVKPNQTGLLFEPGNRQDCITKIKYLWNSSQKTQALGRSALQFAKTEFSPELHYQKIIKIYRQLIKARQSP